MSDMSISDAMALARNEDGIFGGNGGSFLIILILFFLCSGWGGFGNAATQGAITRAEVQDEIQNASIQRDLWSGFQNVNQNLCSGFNSVNQRMCDGFAAENLSLNNGFNSVNQNLNNLGYQMQQCCCDLKNAIHSEGEETRALIQSNTIQDLRDKVADKDRELLATGLTAAQVVQTNNLEAYMRTLLGNNCGCGC